MARTAHLLAAAQAYLEAQTDAAWQEVAASRPYACVRLNREDVSAERVHVRFKRAAFLAQPLALQRRLLRRAFFHLRLLQDQMEEGAEPEAETERERRKRELILHGPQKAGEGVSQDDVDRMLNGGDEETPGASQDDIDALFD